MPKPWRGGLARPAPPPHEPRIPVPQPNHHGLHSKFGPPGSSNEPSTAQHKIIADRCEALNTALLQANARIALQEQALLDAAAEQQRIFDSSGRAVALEHRCEALEAELRVVRRQLAEATGAVMGRDSAWSTHHSLEDKMRANSEAAEISSAELVKEREYYKAELQRSQEATARTAEALEEERAKGERWRERLQQTEDARNSLDVRCVAQQGEIESLTARMSAVKTSEKSWRKERNKLLHEVDKNTASAILRREELYFTRTSLLKETLRLRGELERKPLPDAGLARQGASPTRTRPNSAGGRSGGGGGRGGGASAHSESLHYDAGAGHDVGDGELGGMTAVPPTPTERQKLLVKHPESPRERRLHTPTARPPEPPPPTFVHGLSPRAPRSLDNDAEFQEQLLFEYRAAARAAEYTGTFPPATVSPSRQRMERLATSGEPIAQAVGVAARPPGWRD